MGKDGKRAGFTLIELLVVVVIVAIVMTGVGLSIGATSRVKLRSSCWTLAAGIRYAYSHSVTQRVTTRLKMDFETSTFQLQETSGRVVLNRDDETGEGLKRTGDMYGPDGGLRTKTLLDRQMDSIGESFGGSSSDISTTSGSGSMGGLGMGMGMAMGGGMGGDGASEGDMFSMMDGVNSGHLSDPFLSGMQGGNPAGYRPPRFKALAGRRGEPRKLEGSTAFVTVYSPHAPQPIEEGRAYIYFFPGGMTEHSIIQVSDGDDRVYSIVVHPISGRTEIFNEAIEPEEDLDELQESNG